MLGKTSYALIVSLLLAASALAQGPQIVAGPNYLVSRDGDVPHAEMTIAVNPRDPKNLLATSITATRPEGGWATRTYASRDGGATWTHSEFPEQVEFGGFDPYAVFTPNGDAVFVSISVYSVHDDEGKPRGGLDVYRSTDGGFTWKREQQICCSHDHPQMAVDQSSGTFGGRVYLGTMYDFPFYRIGVFRSDDGGRTFKGPAEVANGEGRIGLNVMSMPVLADGTLVVTMVDFDFQGEPPPNMKAKLGLWIAHSKDGGATFTPRKKVGAIEMDLARNDHLPVPQTAADPSGRHPNNLYMVWSDSRFGAARILYSRSTDRGATWSAPRRLSPDVPDGAKQYMPSIGVNKDGTVAVTWLDTRHSADSSQFHVYFAASADGGATFFGERRITTEPSNPKGAGNLRPLPAVFRIAGGNVLSLLSVADRWPLGGDYLGIASDRTGTFFPVWSDARTGTYQVTTAPIRVKVPPTAEETLRAELRAPWEGKPQEQKPAGRAEADLLELVVLAFDPTTFRDGVVEIPIRLKNKSERTIHAPVRLIVDGFGAGPEPDGDGKPSPEILNATNGVKGGGAEFIFDAALGDQKALAPGGLSGAVAIRLRIPDPEKMPSLRFRTLGMVDSLGSDAK